MKCFHPTTLDVLLQTTHKIEQRMSTIEQKLEDLTSMMCLPLPFFLGPANQPNSSQDEQASYGCVFDEELADVGHVVAPYYTRDMPEWTSDESALPHGLLLDPLDSPFVLDEAVIVSDSANMVVEDLQDGPCEHVLKEAQA